MLFNTFVNINQSKRPSQITNLDDIYEEVINQQPDEQNLLQDMNSLHNVERRQKKNKTKLKIKYSFDLGQQNHHKVFSSLTQSQKAFEIQKIYEQSEINSLLFEIHQIIRKQKQHLTHFIESKSQRKNQLQIYNQKLQSLSDILKQGMGTKLQIKIYISKKVLLILKNIGRFKQQDEYQFLIQRINKIAGIKETQQNNFAQKQKNNFREQHKYNQKNSSIKNQIRRKKKAMTLSLRLENKPPINQNQQPVTFWHRMNHPLTDDDKQFQQILQRVDSIHEKHLKTWFKHNDEIKQLEEKRKQIKSRYSSLHSRKANSNKNIYLTTQTPQNRRVNKFFSLFKGHENLECEEEKQLKQCFQTFQTQVSKRLSSSLPSLNQKEKKNLPKKQHQIKLMIDFDQKRKTLKEPLKLRRNQKRNSTIKSISKSPKHKQSSKRIGRNLKGSDQNLQINKKLVSLQKSVNKNNSVQKLSNFRNLSPLPNNKLQKQKQPYIKKLVPLKNLNNLKQHKLKIT